MRRERLLYCDTLFETLFILAGDSWQDPQISLSLRLRRVFFRRRPNQRVLTRIPCKILAAAPRGVHPTVRDYMPRWFGWILAIGLVACGGGGQGSGSGGPIDPGLV